MTKPRLTEDEQERGRALVDVLRLRRNELQLAQEDVAQGAGLRVDALRTIENYRTFNPGFFTVASISRALEIGLDELALAAERRFKVRRRKRRNGR